MKHSTESLKKGYVIQVHTFFDTNLKDKTNIITDVLACEKKLEILKLKFFILLSIIQIHTEIYEIHLTNYQSDLKHMDISSFNTIFK